MRDAKETSEWDKAALICTIATQMVGGKTQIHDFHPYMSKPKALRKKEFSGIKSALMRTKPRPKAKKPWEV